MSRPDLNALLADAAAHGLTHFSLSRMHSREAMWQAASRWTWSDGYRIAIQPTPEAAAAAALAQPAYRQAPATAPDQHQRVSPVVTPLDDGDPTAEDTEVAEMVEADDPEGRAAYDTDGLAAQEDIFG